ncbi:cytochrome p450 [Moniliophthora roreri]|nr:cytochrome p450 [Moniliophthora roreri]
MDLFLGDVVLARLGKDTLIQRLVRERLRTLSEWASEIKEYAVEGCFELDAFEDLKAVSTFESDPREESHLC